MTFEEYKKKMDTLAKMQYEFDDPSLQDIRDKMEEKYPEFADKYREFLFDEIARNMKK